ncbi:MAG: ABC transporter substrate-binding protein [Alphaproteobacteria bacterium]|nr:ABC transporter substrate-binding protein [Alphaproteobacteria bacterium]
MIRNLLGKCAAGLVTALAVMLAAGGVSAAETVKIGSFLAVTGGASFLGDPEKKALEMYVATVNANGGVDGRQIELVLYDSGGDAKKAAGFVKRLINDDKVDIILGGSTTGETMAVIPLVEKAGVPFISFGGASVIVEPVKKWVFKTPHSDRLAVRRIYQDIKAQGLSRVALFAGSGGFDKSCTANAKELAGEYGMEIVANETHGKGDTDMTAQLTKIKNAAGVQVLLYCGFGADAVVEARNYKQLGMTLPHYQSHGSASMQFVKGTEGASEGMRLPAAALLVARQMPDSHPQKKVGMDFEAAYTAKYNEPISTFGGHAYDGLMIAIGAIKRAGGTDKEKVRTEIENTKNYIGADGIYTMSPEDHLGLDTNSFVMVEIRNGDWKLLD